MMVGVDQLTVLPVMRVRLSLFRPKTDTSLYFDQSNSEYTNLKL